MNIAIIPARGGSKRIKKKNIRNFCGKPMLSWAIEKAKNSNLFDKIVVSTDDIEIKKIAESNGALVPFTRDRILSNDITPTVPVIADAVKHCIDLNWEINFVCCIYPCSPFIQIDDLITAFKIIKEKCSDFVYPVTEFPHPVFRAMSMNENSSMSFVYPEHEMTRTQDLETLFHDTGQFYWGTKDAWILQKKMHTDGIGFTIPKWRVVDIDDHEDWKRAEILFKSYYNNLN